MRWAKQGLIYAPSGALWWARRYATFPTAEVLGGHLVRIYFTSLDDDRYGRTGYVEVDLRNPSRILYETPEPVLDLGAPGLFDDSGANAFSIVRHGGVTYMFYQGWQRSHQVPYMLFTGLATRDETGQFTKKLRIPVLDRTDIEPFIRAAPYVLVEDGIFKMWYASGTGWLRRGDLLHYNVVIRNAISSDGLSWQTSPTVCIESRPPDEYGVGRPCVIRDGPVYRMWYSKRSFSRLYEMGYAESIDGLRWERKDGIVGIEKSTSGWDSEMICYPCVVQIDRRLHMFYNGNQHGSTGFGYAILEN